MKRVLLIADSNMSLSGVPVFFMHVVRQLSDMYTFDIVIFKNNDMYFEKEFLSYGGKIYLFNMKKPNGLFKKYFWILYKYKKNVSSFLKRIDLNRYSVIHSFNEFFSLPFIKCGKKAGIKNLVLNICSASSAYPSKKSFSQLIANHYRKKTFRLCSNIAFVSEKSLLLNNYKNKGVVLHGIYDQKFNQILECNHSNLTLTQIGTFSSRKNQLFSIKLIKSISNKIKNVKLIIVGIEKEKGYLEKMSTSIKEMGIDNLVLIRGTSTNRIELSKETSYIIYPSLMDSFGLVLVESQASGLHCFASNTIPTDADMGNVDFLNLDVDEWTAKIINYFNKYGNERKLPIDKDKFSSEQFRKTVLKLYSH